MDYNSLLKLPCNESLPDNRLYHVSRLWATDNDLHWHEYYELEYILDGEAVEIVNGVSYSVGPGTVTLLSPVDFHAYKNIDPENPLEVIVTSNLAHRRRDLFSTFVQIPPTGLIGDVALAKYEA